MGFLRRLLGQQPPTTRSATIYGGSEWLEVKGESMHQGQLASIAGPKTEDGYNLPVEAVLVRDPSNPYDPNAIAVHASREHGQSATVMVGYINRIDAAKLAPAIDSKNQAGEVVGLRGYIRGGWDKGGGDVGHYGIWLQYDPADF